jgi:ribosomal protein L37AE/L43A
MTKKPTRSPAPAAEPPRCPKCGEDVLIEGDAARGWFCVVCAHSWRDPA